MKRIKIEYVVCFVALALICFLAGVFVGRNSVRISDSVVLEIEKVAPSETEVTVEKEKDDEARLVKDSGESEMPDMLSESTVNELPMETVGEQAADGLMDINTATAEELQMLPGIGEALSQRIIDYREENGPFESVEEIMLVSGIGETKFEAIRSMITVR